MYICLCNALTDSQVRAAGAAGAKRPREVFETCGCGAQCASCTRMIVALLRDTPASAAAPAR